MEQARHWMWTRTKYCSSSSSSRLLVGAGSNYESWEEKAFAEDAGGHLAWPPRSYSCGFCRREFRSAQALGGHMNVHRRDRARLLQLSCSSSSSVNLDGETSTAAAAAGDVDLPRRPDETTHQAPPQRNPNYSCAAASPPSRVSAPPKSTFLTRETATTAKEAVVIRSTARLHDVEQSCTLRRQITVPKLGPAGSNGRCCDPTGVDGEEELSSSCSNKRRRTSEQRLVVHCEVLNHNAVEELDLELRLGSGGLKI